MRPASTTAKIVLLALLAVTLSVGLPTADDSAPLLVAMSNDGMVTVGAPGFALMPDLRSFLIRPTSERRQPVVRIVFRSGCSARPALCPPPFPPRC